MKTCICRVYGEETGTGFFCKIQYEGESIPVLMTNYNIISDDFLKNSKEVKISINDGDGEEYDTININENSKLYSSMKEKYDIMIIKLEEEKYIYDYLEIDDHLFDEKKEKIYEDKSIYILHYPMGKSHVSFVNRIQKENEYYIKYLCNIEHCSSGAPILNLETNKVLGIHRGFVNNKNDESRENKYNIGILLKYPLYELNKSKEIEDKNVLKAKNEIKIEVKIDKYEVNGDIYFLDNTKYSYYSGNNKIEHYHDNLKELNKLNTELYINDKKYEYKKYFNPDKEGIYIIKLKYNININLFNYIKYNYNI